ncbi:SEC-C domain-containing protein [Candidatus Kaiserbacteria bacterium]|nr:SEC-C domain-containing protein [Candidatus Kaiserbacteria bacterium]
MPKAILNTPQLAELSSRVKKKCGEYCLEHFEREFKESEFGKWYADSAEDYADEAEVFGALVRALDSFLLFGEARSGVYVLDELAHTRGLFDKEERQVLSEWREHAFASVFEIRGVGESSFSLFDVIAEVLYEAYVNDIELKPSEMLVGRGSVGYFMRTNLAPVKGSWFLSGGQDILSPSSRRMIFEAVVKESREDAMYRNNLEKLSRAFERQKEQYDDFVRVFGSNETVVRGEDLPREIARLFKEQSRRKGADEDMAEGCGITEAEIRETIPEEMIASSDVGILMDEKEGFHQALDYGAFLSAFKSTALSPQQIETVASYLGEETIPAFVFRRARDRYPENYTRVMRGILALFEEPAETADDFERTMDVFKPGWREIYPSIHPMNQFFEKEIYEDMSTGRNDPCPCGSGKKFKKCHG